MPLRCAILDDYQKVAFSMADWSELDGKIEIDRFHDHIGDADELAAKLADYDMVLAMRERTPFPAAFLGRLPKLKLLLTTGMVNASIDMEAAARLGITVAGTRGSAGAAAELTWGLLLALVRHIPAENANFHQGGSQWQLTVGRDLKGRTLGVAGIGRLGQLVAGYGRAFGMNVLGWSRSNTPERSAELGIGFAASLDALLEASDIVSLHLPLNAETRAIIGKRELDLMKPGAILLNTSRGPLVDENAMVAALESGGLGGAGLDVFDTEPLPLDHALRRFGNVIATPHLGYVTEESYRIYFSEAVEDISAWLAGNPVRVLNQPDPALLRR
ncbi:D-2-hydroxyacid dehydrogenase family protein [Rhizobium lusitanum]|uniref:D-2-hydroxyacid dehydrogenase family protein n=1 Tax=Rhizobium lusitanum TaxID=293958 RepID=A0A6L9UJL7_9HYPH|nr:D-2-hydroxyacid dehydrogenase family protein [Rhizobium lusitanum]NEI74572.1 D-2-hydroxyacid dehydrogenase family protein [Rhizobium lusitanum]